MIVRCISKFVLLVWILNVVEGRPRPQFDINDLDISLDISGEPVKKEEDPAVPQNQPIPSVISSEATNYIDSEEDSEAYTDYGPDDGTEDEIDDGDTNYIESELDDEDEEDDYGGDNEDDDDIGIDEGDQDYGENEDEDDDGGDDYGNEDEGEYGGDDDDDEEDDYGGDDEYIDEGSDEEKSPAGHPGGPGRGGPEVIPAPGNVERQYLSLYRGVHGADAFTRLSRLMVDTVAEVAQGPQAWPGVLRTYGHHLLDSTVDNGFRQFYKGLQQHQTRRRKNPLTRRKPSYLQWLQFFPAFTDEDEDEDDDHDFLRQRRRRYRNRNRYYRARRRFARV